MAKNKLHNVNARINDSLKIRVQAYAIKHGVSESEVLRLALKNFLPTNVTKAKQFVNNYQTKGEQLETKSKQKITSVFSALG